MTSDERQQLKRVVSDLEAVQAVAPSKTTYSRGRTDEAVSVRLLKIIGDIKGLLDDSTKS